LKGQPLAYNKDMQEDKEALFDSVDTVLDTINIMSAMLPSCSFNREHMKTAAEANFSLATDYADYLTKKNVPFREAHNAVGSLVSFCEKENKTLAELTLEELQNIHPTFDKGALKITIEYALNARAVNGGTAPQTVEKARKAAQLRLNEETK
jgi:argininosuccinate lyase